MTTYYLQKESEGVNAPRIEPTSITITVSGKRFASYVDLEFEDVGDTFSPDYWRSTFRLFAFDPVSQVSSFLYRWGGSTASIEERGEARVYKVRLTPGGYRTNPSVLHLSNAQLEKTLYDYLTAFVRGSMNLGQRTEIAGGPEDDGDVLGYQYSNANTLTQWSSIIELGYNLANIPIPFDNYLPDLRRVTRAAKLLDRIVANTISAPTYDDRARILWDKFNLLTVLDLGVQSKLSGTYSLPSTLTEPTHLKSQYVTIPNQPTAGTDLQPLIAIINPLDDITNLDGLDNLLTVTYTRDWDLEIDQNEPIIYNYELAPDGDDWDFVGNLDDAFDLAAFNKWKADGADTTELNYRNSKILWESKGLGQLQALLHQHELNKRNRTLQANVVTPPTAQQIVNLFPGNPVKIYGKGYWIIESSTNFPDLLTTLTLFDANGPNYTSPR